MSHLSKKLRLQPPKAMRPQTVTLAVCRYSVSWFSVLSLNICLLFLGSVVSLSSGKVACSGKRRLRPLLSSHDAEEECAGDSLQYHIDEGQNERDRADVIKSLPCIGVLCRFTFPDWFHDEDPQTIHHEGHHRQQDHLFQKAEESWTRLAHSKKLGNNEKLFERTLLTVLAILGISLPYLLFPMFLII